MIGSACYAAPGPWSGLGLDGTRLRRAALHLGGQLGALLDVVRLKERDPSDPPGLPGLLPTEEASAAQWFTGRTVLYYNAAHGNQIEYYDPSGWLFLWYPNNRGAVPGGWYIEGAYLYAQYGNNVYNPVTRTWGGNWEPSTLLSMLRDVVDSVQGDVFGLSTGRVPFPLRAHPAYRSIAEVKP